MSTRRPFRPQVEGLESRTVLSTLPPLSPPAGAAAVLQGHHHHGHHQHLSLHGEVTGAWLVQPRVADAGTTQELTGSGNVRPLGAVQVSGSLLGPGFIAQGFTTATLTLSGAHGSITVQLVGAQAQPGFSAPPHAFRYTIVGGTGAYAGATGGGTARLEEMPAYQVGPPGSMTPIHAPTFTLAFGPDAG
jgi:hypothetical protein